MRSQSYFVVRLSLFLVGEYKEQRVDFVAIPFEEASHGPYH